MSQMGQSPTKNDVRDEGSFPPKRSPGAGDGCTADHCQPGSLLVAQLAPIADTEAGTLASATGQQETLALQKQTPGETLRLSP
jgi:hypothetical protein